MLPAAIISSEPVNSQRLGEGGGSHLEERAKILVCIIGFHTLADSGFCAHSICIINGYIL